MDFPDKIYAYFSFPKISCHLRSRMWCIDPVGPGENIEYIRKDTLVKWVENGLKITTELARDSDVFEGERIVFDCLLDNLKSM